MKLLRWLFPKEDTVAIGGAWMRLVAEKNPALWEEIRGMKYSDGARRVARHYGFDCPRDMPISEFDRRIIETI